ncbi:MAG: NIL domain-containing protein [Deltaproteobacteria bacterium]|nr:NIL domain-containing protein [Deltaproteobacteria bacterium]
MATKTPNSTVSEPVYLTFPQNLIREPVLSQMAKRFDIEFNIRGSTVTTEMALVALEIDGARREVDKAIGWLKAKGVAVEPSEKKPIRAGLRRQRSKGQ